MASADSHKSRGFLDKMGRAFDVAGQWIGEKTGFSEAAPEDAEVCAMLDKLEITETELKGLVGAAKGFLDPDDGLTKMRDKVVGFISAEDDRGHQVDNPAQRMLDNEITQARDLESKYKIAKLALDSASADHAKAIKKNKQSSIDSAQEKLDEAQFEYTDLHDKLMNYLRIVEQKKDSAFKDTVQQLIGMLQGLRPSWDHDMVPLNDQQQLLQQQQGQMSGISALGSGPSIQPIQQQAGIGARPQVSTPREHGESIL